MLEKFQNYLGIPVSFSEVIKNLQGICPRPWSWNQHALMREVKLWWQNDPVQYSCFMFENLQLYGTDVKPRDSSKDWPLTSLMTLFDFIRDRLTKMIVHNHRKFIFEFFWRNAKVSLKSAHSQNRKEETFD